MPTDTIMAALLEELRFAKRQQWAVTIAGITLIAGAFHIAGVKQPLGFWEKVGATGFIWFVVIGGCWLLYKLQCHLRSTRLVINWRDKTAWQRGADVVIAMMIALTLSAIAVCYSFWRD
jgi:hypothetical protein